MPLLKCSKQLPKIEKLRPTFYHLALANGYYTPHIERERRWTMCSNRAFRKALEVVRWMVWEDRNLCHGMFHDGFLVAPKKWPTQVRSAWGLKEPPSPYETACAMLIEPQPGFWQLAKGAPGNGLPQSVLYWWLAGLHEEAIINTLGQRSRSLIPNGLERLMSQFIQHAMTKKRFAFWALGTNPIPACTSRHISRVALALMEGRKMERRGKDVNSGTNNGDKKALKRFLEHPYVTGQLKSGVRTAPISRPLYKDGVVWGTLEAKLAWLKENAIGGERVLGARKILSKYPSQHPDWLKMTHV